MVGRGCVHIAGTATGISGIIGITVAGGGIGAAAVPAAAATARTIVVVVRGHSRSAYAKRSIATCTALGAA